MNRWPSILASALTIILGVYLISVGTDKGQAWTAEGARRIAVRETPLEVPQASLIGDQGHRGKLITAVSLEDDAPLLLVEFIYTRCPTVCLAMGAEFRSLQTYLTAKGLDQKVRLLSLSFDEKDDPNDLADYLQRFSADRRSWSAAKFQNQAQLDEIKRRIGLIVIPEPTVGFVHNAAVYVIWRGQVVDILDHDDRKGIRDVIYRHIDSYQSFLM